MALPAPYGFNGWGRSLTLVFPPACLCLQGHVNNQVKKSVVKALYNLPSRSPWTEAANYYAWVTPMSYLPVQRLLEETGHLSGSASVRRCTRDTSLYANIHCPEGTYKLPEADFGSSCADQNHTCDTNGQLCVCRPCRVLPPYPVEIYAVGRGALNASEPCKKMHTCSSVRQRQTFSYRLVRRVGLKRGAAALPSPSAQESLGLCLYVPQSPPRPDAPSLPPPRPAPPRCAGGPHVRAAPQRMPAGRHALVVPLQVPRPGIHGSARGTAGRDILSSL